MTTDRYDLDVKVGGSWAMAVGLSVANGWPPLTGAVARASIATRRGQPPLANMTCVVDVVGEKIELSLTDEDTTALASALATGAEWDLRVEYSADDIRYPLEGKVVLKGRVTS